MVYSLSYRRPPHVSSSSLNGQSRPRSQVESVGSGGSCDVRGIPEALAFDRVITGGTCPPCTLRDFMNYLIYIEHAAENLQFYLWFRDYTKRFEALDANQKALSPLWTFEKLDPEAVRLDSNEKILVKVVSAGTEAMFKGTDFDKPKVKVLEYNPSQNPFSDYPTTPDEVGSVTAASDYGWARENSTLKSNGTNKADYHQKVAHAYESADVKLQPFTIQPFREEITRIIATYITDDAPRQLNLASKERTCLLRALATTTHPSAFRDVLQTVEWSLRHQAHPNFIRWTICNGNPSRVAFARGLGVSGILGGLATCTILALSSASRAWRVLGLIPFLIGIATLFAAWKGMCVVLHGMHHRHVRPWELFADDSESASTFELGGGKGHSTETFGSSNSYEDEPWVAKYEKRNLIRKIFDREVWIQEPALRQIQDTIFLQAILGALFMSTVIVGIFVAIPQGDKF